MVAAVRARLERLPQRVRLPLTLTLTLTLALTLTLTLTPTLTLTLTLTRCGGPLSGVLHTAGVLRDALSRRMEAHLT